MQNLIQVIRAYTMAGQEVTFFQQRRSTANGDQPGVKRKKTSKKRENSKLRKFQRKDLEKQNEIMLNQKLLLLKQI